MPPPQGQEGPSPWQVGAVAAEVPVLGTPQGQVRDLEPLRMHWQPGETRHVGGPQAAGVAAPASNAQAPRGKAEAPLSTHGGSCYTKTPNP